MNRNDVTVALATGVLVFVLIAAVWAQDQPHQTVPWTMGNGAIEWSTKFVANSKSLIVIRQNDGIVRDGDGRDLAELPLAEQVAKLCAALEGVAHAKFTKCGGSQ